MPNKNLQHKKFYCPILNKEISYEYMKKIKSFFDNYDGDNKKQFGSYGGERMKKWVNQVLKDKRDSIYYEKKTRMDAGESNQFKKSHNKDKDNVNVTNVNIPKIAKGSKLRHIMTNKTVYENVNEEIKGIKYLITYMNNNNKI
jgi:hypothetical protein